MTSEETVNHQYQEGIRPRIRIKSNDPVARGILEQFYDQCKEKELSEILTELESQFVSCVETAYQDERAFENEEVQSIFEQVYEILDNAEKLSQEQEAMFEALRKVIIPGEHRCENVDKFFEQTKETVKAAKRLDFSVKAPLVEDKGCKHNFLTYTSVSINNILETARFGMLTINVLNAISTQLEDTVFIATDLEGNIRTINSNAERMFGVNIYEAARCKIQEFIIDFDKVHKDYRKGQTQWKDLLTRSVGTKDGFELCELVLVETDSGETEVKELVYILQPQRPFDLRLNRNAHIIKIQGIIQAAKTLESQQGENELLSDIIKYAWSIRDLLQGSISSLLLKAPKGCDSISFKEILDSTFGDVQQSLELEVVNNYTGDFMAVPGDIEQLFSFLLDLVTTINEADLNSSHFYIEVKEVQQLGALITCSIPNLQFSKDEQGEINFRQTTEFQNLIKITDKYFGFVDLISLPDTPGIIQICIPHVR